MKIQMTKLNLPNQLDEAIRETAENIHDFIDDPRAFTRNRKLDLFTMLKVTINMQGNSLDSEAKRDEAEAPPKRLRPCLTKNVI